MTGFWARALPCSVRGADALTLTAGDHLLHACLHGYRRGSRVSGSAGSRRRHNPGGPLPRAAWETLLHEAGRTGAKEFWRGPGRAAGNPNSRCQSGSSST